MSSYEDILHLPHHQSEKHPHMSMIDRGAQFSPFAALTGYEDAIQETARLADDRIEVSDGDIAADELNEAISILLEHPEEHREVRVTYFVPDIKKAGGSYEDHIGYVKRIDTAERRMIFTDRFTVELNDILSIRFSE